LGSSSITDLPLRESRLPVGSSASSITGSPATARATATRCCCRRIADWVGASPGGHADALERLADARRRSAAGIER
jgi:hypothetical protein